MYMTALYLMLTAWWSYCLRNDLSDISCYFFFFCFEISNVCCYQLCCAMFYSSSSRLWDIFL